MQGYHVARKAGWDCHGLPVELAVEKELGFTGKHDIEAYGIAEFNARCRESVQRHVDAFERDDRADGLLGRHVDDAYWTMDPAYVERVWWSLKQIFDKGLLVEDHRVAPYCPRCGTGLSDHELAQGYETVVDPSVYVRFPLTSGPLRRHGRRPAGLDDDAVDAGVQHRGRGRTPTSTYVVARTDGTETLVVAEPLLGKALGEGWTVDRRAVHRHASMERWTYQRPFDLVDDPRARTSWSSPTTSPPRTAPGWCTRPPPSAPTTSRSAAAYGLPVVNPVRPRRPLRRRRAAGRRACSSRHADADAGRRPARRAACCSGTCRTSTPTRTAGAATRRCSTTRSRPGTSAPPRSRTRCSRENESDQLVPGDDQARPLRRLAEQQHRLGAVAQPLLGHAAADLALRRRAT